MSETFASGGVRLNGRKLLFAEAGQLGSFEFSFTFSHRLVAVVAEKYGEEIDPIPKRNGCVWLTVTGGSGGPCSLVCFSPKPSCRFGHERCSRKMIKLKSAA